MNFLAMETMSRKAEIAFYHPAGAIVLLIVWALATSISRVSVEKLYDALSSGEKAVALLYAAFAGIVASFLGLSHSMFKWGVWQHSLLQLIFMLILVPAFLILVRAAMRAKLTFVHAAGTIPLACIVLYYIFALVYIASPLTAVE